MEMALISALIAAAVSVIGLVVNVYIVLKNRQAAAALKEREVFLETHRIALSDLRDFCRGIESCRIQASSIARRIEVDILANKWTRFFLAHQLPTTMKILSRDADELRTRYAHFRDMWARVRSDFPEPLADELQRARHFIEPAASKFSSYAETIATLSSQNLNAEDQVRLERTFRASASSLHELDRGLARIFDVVNDHRTNFLHDAVFGGLAGAKKRNLREESDDR